MAGCVWPLLLCALLVRVSPFNLDTGNVIRMSGEPGSLFGFSLAMHRQLRPTDLRMLLVGAPRAKALAKQKSNFTGGLWKCEMPNKCTRVDFDNEEDRKVEEKENQWMGVTVQSQGPGGKVLACAHRYQRLYFPKTTAESRNFQGRCYVLSEDLSINPNAEEDGGNWMFCQGRQGGHEHFGYCQQGMSATFTKDYHYLVFGAPGAYNWKGIVRAEQKNSTLLDMDIYDDGPFEVGGESQLNSDLVPVPANSYLGFSLDTGHSITQKKHLTVVAGAPRANHSGAVILLKKDEQTKLLTQEYVLEGQGLASSFGYDIAVADLNGDGWQDIVVGAPQYFVKDGDVGGAIYVYINNEGKWDKIIPIQVNGTRDSMFGLAVENIGDINLDSYEDVAVGAPYDNNGAGKVYIYHGSKNGINTNPAQILEVNDPNVKLFGYSLAGKMDMDMNFYPDLAVGSLSDAVFVYRTKPIISIEKRITTNPKQIDFTKKNCGDSICMSIETCLVYTANPATYNPKLTIGYSIEAEAERRKLGLPSRVVFQTKSATDRDYQSTGTMELQGQNKPLCRTDQLKLQDNIKDKLRGISFEVSVDIKSSKRRKRQAALPQLLPVLNSNQPSKAVTEVNFLKEGCGSDNICQSNLKMSYRFCYKEGDDNFLPLPEQNGVPVISLTDQKVVALEVNVTNVEGDDAYEAKLEGTFYSSLTYSGYRSHNTAVSCVANQNGSCTTCELGNPFKKNAEATFYIILSTSSISLNTNDVEIALQLSTTSDQKGLTPVKAKAKVSIELQLSVIGVARPSQVNFGNKAVGESAIKTEDEIGTLIEYEFKVINIAKQLKSFGKAYLIFQWPKENHNGKWVLYLMKMSSNCTPHHEINPLTIKEATVSKKKRSAEETEQTDDKSFIKKLFSEKRKYKTLTCENELRCVEIKCPLQGLENDAAIVLRSRLWNTTFVEDYSKLNYLDIIVKAKLALEGSAENVILKNADTQVRVTVFPEKTVAHYGGVPWWVILLSILLGILMLALLVFLLYKCGFFKRAKKDQYDAAYHKAEIHVQPSEKPTTEA